MVLMVYLWIIYRELRYELRQWRHQP